MRAPVTWRVPPKSYVNVSDVRWVPGRQFDHPLSVVTPLRVRSTGYPASVNVADAVVVSKVAALDVVAVVTITARCAGRGPVGVVTVPGTRTTPTLAVTSPTPPQSQTTGNSKARGLVPTWAGTVAGAWAWTSASDAPTKAWVDTGSVSVKSPTSTNAAASKGVPNTSVPTPVTVTVPGTPQLSAPGRSHVTTTGVPAPHGYCGTTVDGNVGATPTAVATCTGDTDCNAVLRNVHLWWAPVLLAHVPTVVPGAVPSPATYSLLALCGGGRREVGLHENGAVVGPGGQIGPGAVRKGDRALIGARPGECVHDPRLTDRGVSGAGHRGDRRHRGAVRVTSEQQAAAHPAQEVAGVVDRGCVGRDTGHTVHDQGGHRLRRHRQGRRAGCVVDGDRLAFDQRVGLQVQGGRGSGDDRGDGGTRGDRPEPGQVHRDRLCGRGGVDVHQAGPGLVCAHEGRRRRVVGRYRPIAGVDVVGEVADGVVLGVGQDTAGRVGVAGGEAPGGVAVHVAVEVDVDAAPVLLLGDLHVPQVLDRLPEHPCGGFELPQVIHHAGGHAQAVLHVGQIQSDDPAPVALDLAHPQGLAGRLGDVPGAHPVVGAVGVHVQLRGRSAGRVRPPVPVGHERAGVGLVGRRDHRLGGRGRVLSLIHISEP